MSDDLIKRIDALEREVSALKSANSYDPDTVRAMQKIVHKESSANPADYDKAVNEGGAGTYNVADVPDGFFLVENKLIPYYNI